MADRPLPSPLPADLPEDWAEGQIVAPEGASAGLSERHGYNYLMRAVNAAQRAANTINEGFDAVSGKRTCRFVVGASTAGWTQADCDFLCDGTDDQEEINQAIAALPVSDEGYTGGGEIVVLDGRYNLTAPLLQLNHVYFHGNGESTIFVRQTKNTPENPPVSSSGTSFRQWLIGALYSTVADFTWKGGIELFSDDDYPTDWQIVEMVLAGSVCKNVRFLGYYGGAIALSGTNTYRLSSVENCLFATGQFGVAMHGYERCSVKDNVFDMFMDRDIVRLCGYEDNRKEMEGGIISGNIAAWGGEITLEGGNSCIISNNVCQKITVKPISGMNKSGWGHLICSNLFNTMQLSTNKYPAIVLGENTQYNFVTGNQLANLLDNKQSIIQDLGAGNIIHSNSNDAGGSGGGGSGVSSFKSRTGAVLPQSGDYTAGMVGAATEAYVNSQITQTVGTINTALDGINGEVV